MRFHTLIAATFGSICLLGATQAMAQHSDWHHDSGARHHNSGDRHRNSGDWNRNNGPNRGHYDNHAYDRGHHDRWDRGHYDGRRHDAWNRGYSPPPIVVAPPRYYRPPPPPVYYGNPGVSFGLTIR